MRHRSRANAARPPRIVGQLYDFTFVEQAPLPRHERAWRHPSEVAAELKVQVNAERASTSTRVAAITVGTTGLLLIGLLVLSIAPARPENPVALSSTTLPLVASAGTVSVAVDPGARQFTSAERFVFRPSGAIEQGPPVTTSIIVVRPLATPIGDGTIALVTTQAFEQHADSRRTDESLTVEVDNWWGSAVALADVGTPLVTLIRLDGVQPGDLDSHVIAAEQPDPNDIVLVMTYPPTKVPLSDLDELLVRDGTAVLDLDGDLVGLCVVHHDDGASLASIDPAAVDTAVEAPTTTLEVASSASTDTD